MAPDRCITRARCDVVNSQRYASQRRANAHGVRPATATLPVPDKSSYSQTSSVQSPEMQSEL